MGVFRDGVDGAGGGRLFRLGQTPLASSRTQMVQGSCVQLVLRVFPITFS